MKITWNIEKYKEIITPEDAFTVELVSQKYWNNFDELYSIGEKNVYFQNVKENQYFQNIDFYFPEFEKMLENSKVVQEIFQLNSMFINNQLDNNGSTEYWDWFYDNVYNKLSYSLKIKLLNDLNDSNHEGYTFKQFKKNCFQNLFNTEEFLNNINPNQRYSPEYQLITDNWESLPENWQKKQPVFKVLLHSLSFNTNYNYSNNIPKINLADFTKEQIKTIISTDKKDVLNLQYSNQEDFFNNYNNFLFIIEEPTLCQRLNRNIQEAISTHYKNIVTDEEVIKKLAASKLNHFTDFIHFKDICKNTKLMLELFQDYNIYYTNFNYEDHLSNPKDIIKLIHKDESRLLFLKPEQLTKDLYFSLGGKQHYLSKKFPKEHRMEWNKDIESYIKYFTNYKKLENIFDYAEEIFTKKQLTSPIFLECLLENYNSANNTFTQSRIEKLLSNALKEVVDPEKLKQYIIKCPQILPLLPENHIIFNDTNYIIPIIEKLEEINQITLLPTEIQKFLTELGIKENLGKALEKLFLNSELLENNEIKDSKTKTKKLKL